MHTIIPGMVFEKNKLFMSYGVMGGDYQPMGHSDVLSSIFNSLDMLELYPSKNTTGPIKASPKANPMNLKLFLNFSLLNIVGYIINS